MTKMTVRDIDVRGKKVILRVDFNVPFDAKTGEISDDSRIKASLPTIQYLIEQQAKVILMSHLGRPNGKVINSLRMAPIARRLSKILGKIVQTTDDCIGQDVEKTVAGLAPGDVILVENLRFHPEEEAGTPWFAQALARLGDIYINDAFGTAHRAHASITGIASYLPAVAGFLMEKEITFLGHVLENPARPFGALIGGAKISDKVKMLERIVNKVDYLMIGGGMAATFFKAKSLEIGKSIFELDRLDTANLLLNKAGHNGLKLLLSSDVIVAEAIDAGVKTQIVPVEKIPPDKMIVDIGPDTIKKFSETLKNCKTIFWNGPMGIYEIPPFANGTRALAQLLASLKATTIIGGGSTAEVVTEMKLEDQMTFVSTGGGASLSFVSGEKLPGVEILLDKKL
jgi:phosphoglycerate kinase